MADGSNATKISTLRTRLPAQSAEHRRLPDPWLVTIATAFMLAQPVFVRPDFGPDWGKTVYVSQVSGHVPAAYFSTPRSRGISLLVAAWGPTARVREHLARGEGRRSSGVCGTCARQGR